MPAAQTILSKNVQKAIDFVTTTAVPGVKKDEVVIA
jgi:hypothetical protein